MGIYQRKEELYRIILDTTDEEKIEELLIIARRIRPRKPKYSIQKAKLEDAKTGLQPHKTLQEYQAEQAPRRISFSEWEEEAEKIDWGEISLAQLLKAID